MAKFHNLEIKDIYKETEDCSVISFSIPENLQEEFTFKQGQYLTLRTTINDEDIRRSYSLCSSPKDNEWKVAVKQIPQGKFSTFVNQTLKKGDTLPDLHGIDNAGNEIMIKDLTKNSKTVIYFWPTDTTKANKLNSKLSKLEKKYPDVLFIGFERNKDNTDWKKFISAKNLPSNTQFSIAKNSECYPLFSGDMDRAIIINKEGTIKNGFLFFNDSYFEKHLKSLK